MGMTALLRGQLSPLIVQAKWHRMLFAPQPAEYGQKRKCSKSFEKFKKNCVCNYMCQWLMVIQGTGLAERYIGLRTLLLHTSSRLGFARSIYVCVCVCVCVLYKTENTRWWWWWWQWWRSFNSVHSFITNLLAQQPYGRLQGQQHSNIKEYM